MKTCYIAALKDGQALAFSLLDGQIVSAYKFVDQYRKYDTEWLVVEDEDGDWCTIGMHHIVIVNEIK